MDEAVRQWRIDREGRRLPVTGLTVRQVRVDHRLTFLLGEAAADDAHDAEALLVVAATARLEGAEGPAATLVPGEQLVAPALALFGTVTTSAVARPDGHLVLEFSDGTRLTVAPDPGLDGRAWSVTDPRGNPLT
ncbi:MULTISPECIES: DUF6188 family protein [unclassified Streptomyces]|uniref:DUF6188 family protein n=1 Tax=Streptomyces sp. SID8379 TaxID=2690359 RepID=UPI001F420100|nr:DUF6188 family protein [Streptomyces sp. HmicA12]